MRERIKSCGGEVHFETRVDRLLIHDGEAIGVETNRGETFMGPVILATGHSARDVYRYLYQAGIAIEAKGIAVGVRLEHPQRLIDQIQYHRREGRGEYLPAAEYSFVTQAAGRGVYSFCMCPGGFVVPAASGPHQVVVNGMSPSNRGSRWANSGMVVEISLYYRTASDADVMTVPMSSVFSHEGQPSVWCVDTATMTVGRKEIATAGLSEDGNVVVTGGLAGDEILVTAGVSMLREGDKVRLSSPIME